MKLIEFAWKKSDAEVIRNFKQASLQICSRSEKYISMLMLLSFPVSLLLFVYTVGWYLPVLLVWIIVVCCPAVYFYEDR